VNNKVIADAEIAALNDQKELSLVNAKGVRSKKHNTLLLYSK